MVEINQKYLDTLTSLVFKFGAIVAGYNAKLNEMEVMVDDIYKKNGKWYDIYCKCRKDKIRDFDFIILYETKIYGLEKKYLYHANLFDKWHTKYVDVTHDIVYEVDEFIRLCTGSLLTVHTNKRVAKKNPEIERMLNDLKVCFDKAEGYFKHIMNIQQKINKLTEKYPG